MTITNGQSQKQHLYPPAYPLMIEKFLLRVEEEEKNLIQTSNYSICTITTALANSPIDEDTFIKKCSAKSIPC
jgi:hypothetical protein